MIFNEVSEPSAPFSEHTLTEAVAMRLPLPPFALIVVMPHPAGLTTPPEETVATAVILDSQTTLFVMSSVYIVPFLPLE
jgi:hypothetical protein